MTLNKAHKDLEHNRKVVFVYASHRQILRPSTFHLLYHRALHDAILRSFLETAYESIRCEASAAADSLELERSGAPALPASFEGLAETTAAPLFSFFVLSLTTLAQIGTVLAARQDFKDAMSGDFPAVWDPESFLTMRILHTTDASSTLEVIARAVETIRLATWIDMFLSPGSFEEAHGRLERLTVRGGDGMHAVLDKCRQGNNLIQQTLYGFTLGVSPHGPEAGVLHESQGVLVTEKSKVPLLDEAQWTRIHDGLQACIEKRRIGVSLCPGMALCGDPSSIIEVDLADLFRMPDIGRSQAQSDGALAQLAHDINLSRVYIPNVNVLLVGGTTDDACISAVTRHLTSQAMPHEHIKLLNLLSPKDSQRFGNEPVNLSKVKGNPCEQIAIVGMSCRVPGASDADDLWRLLQEGKDTLQEIPERLYRYQDYHSASYRDRNVMRVRTANCLSDPSLFDKSLLEGVGSVDDCAKLDPQQRLAILTIHEALQRAGYGFSPRHPPKHPQQWSSHFAYCSDDYREHLSRDIDGSLVPSTHRAHLVARVNETFGFRGEACSYDTACSSALAAVERACSSLLAGETSAAVTGGVNIITQPQITIGLDRGFFLSPSSQCMTLDDAGSGYSRADAVSIMLLKRLTDAVRDKDPILAVISSAATNHSGESFSITHPHGETQCRLYQSGMLASGTLPRDYSYIEMHGTGTQSGDLEEVTGIVETFGAKKRPGESSLVLGSVKANVGHSEAASGATSMIKTIQIYNHDLVPRHIGIRTKLNTKLPPLDGLHIPLEETKIDRLNSTFTLVDNFSAAGGNSSIIMDRGSRYRERLSSLSKEAEAMPDDSVSSVKQHLLFVTAATPFSLDAHRRQLIAFLDQNRDVSLREFCSNVSLSDAMYRYRLIGTPATLAEAKACLSSQESICVSDRSVKDMAIGIAFSGQGAQYLDMGRELYEHSLTFRRHVDACNTIALSLGLPALVVVIHPGCNEASAQRDSTVGTRAADAFSPAQYQLALTAVEVGLASLLLDWGLKPACLVGHSLGEYTAMWMSGILSLHSLIDLVGRRALLMMERCQPNATSMLAIRVHRAQVAQLLKESGSESLEIACMNSPNDTVVAGSTVEIETLMRLCEHKEPKIKAMAIPVPYAFHSKAVEPLMEDYAEVAARHRFSQPKISIASNVLGQVIDGRNASITADYLVRHLRQPVRFCEAILDLQSKLQIDTWVEVGPHPTCIPMLKGCYAESEHAPAFLASFRRGSSSWSSILGLVKELASRGIDLDWGKAFGDLGLRFCHKGLSASLPLYPFDYEEHWIPFKDRGLRDGLNPASIKQPDAAETSTKREVPSKPRLPRPSYALLSQCVRLEADPPSAQFLARTNQRPFSDMIKGHIILGTELVPATVFVELAQEAGMYWWDLDAKAARPAGQKEEDVVIEVLELSMVASLYLNERDPKQSIEVSLQGDPWSHGGSIVQFFSHSEHRHQKHQYGACRIRIVSVDAAQHDWTKLAHLIQTAAAKVQADSSSVIKTKTVYRNFEAIVKYLGGFRGMETVWLSEGGEEATSEVRHHNEAAHGRFVCSPMLLDSLGGLTGFISNVRFAEGPYVYMADGIGRIVTLPGLRKMQPGGATSVRVYARMQRDKDLSRGDAYFFLPDGRFMGSMEEIVFKRIRRDMLLRLVQLSSKAFFNEADRAVKAQPSANVHESDNPSQNSARRSSTNQPKPIPGLESKANGSAAHNARLQGETSSDSPMNELTDPSKRSNASKPRHIAGPPLKHFDGRDVLFLFPDGSGTSQMYPRVDTGGRLSIYGFDSPYLGHIGAWSRGVGELVDQYVEMLCRAQPHGPYRLGGWSIGGVVVLEVCRRLLSLGHEVAFVGLIDTPSPLQIKPIPTGTLDEMLGRIASPTVREHFRSCALSLPGYRCLAFAENDAKPAKIIVVNAAHDSGLKPVMASEPEWRTFWSGTAHLAWHQVAGDHWTCLEPALRLIVESAL